ncbi:hypothetical protein DXG01_000700 [Tephrocybe rancida]|nr:hypothetical protein DXG01_000700 [Tephrocybe rancida]
MPTGVFTSMNTAHCLTPHRQHELHEDSDEFDIDTEDLDSLRALLRSRYLLEAAVQANQKAHFQPLTASIITCVQSLFAVTETLKQGTPFLRRHTPLAQGRRQVLSTLADLVALARTAAEGNLEQNSEDLGDGMLNGSDQVIAEVKAMLSIMIQSGITLPDRWKHRDLTDSNALSGTQTSFFDTGDRHRGFRIAAASVLRSYTRKIGSLRLRPTSLVTIQAQQSSAGRTRMQTLRDYFHSQPQHHVDTAASSHRPSLVSLSGQAEDMERRTRLPLATRPPPDPDTVQPKNEHDDREYKVQIEGLTNIEHDQDGNMNSPSDSLVRSSSHMNTDAASSDKPRHLSQLSNKITVDFDVVITPLHEATGEGNTTGLRPSSEQDPEMAELSVRKDNPANVIYSGAHKTLSLLIKILTQPELYRRFLGCRGSEAQIILELCQVLLDSYLPSATRGQIITAMRRLSARTQKYPLNFFISEAISFVDEEPIASGSFGDIYKATLANEVLCVKVLRSNKSMLQHMTKLYAKESIVWSQLSHPCVLPFYGLYPYRSQIAFVSPWAKNGGIKEYLLLNQESSNPDRILLANILIDHSGRAYLADFGLSNVNDPQILHWASESPAASRGGSARWQAPELHRAESDNVLEESLLGTINNTKMSDVFAWGCLCYEIFTGRLPFYELRFISTVVLKITQGQTPSRPKAELGRSWLKNSLEPVWGLMEKCWKFDPMARPSMQTIVSWLELEKPSNDPRPDPQWPAGSTMRFRNLENAFMGTNRPQHTIENLDVILRRVIEESNT